MMQFLEKEKSYALYTKRGNSQPYLWKTLRINLSFKLEGKHYLYRSKKEVTISRIIIEQDDKALNLIYLWMMFQLVNEVVP